MSIHKHKNGYIVRVRVDGKQLSRTVKSLSKAKQLEVELNKTPQADYDKAKLSVLIKLWFDMYGIYLKDGKNRYNKLIYLLEDMGNIPFHQLKAEHFLTFRNKRLTSGISANTINHDLAYFKTVFNKLLRSGYISSNPFVSISALKIDEAELTFLTHYQIKRLLVECKRSINESLFYVTLFCLRTGARWSEAEKLKRNQLVNNCVIFTKTKSGKNRVVPLKQDFYSYLITRPALPNGRIFGNCSEAFKNAIKRAKITLPPGQSTHVLRHTFASHFIMNGGDILTLQKLLGHSDLKLTMRYSHLSPDYMQNSLKYLAI